eukprot:TRINITY_DN1430_c1_g1_i1.p1 TRINITY_DN1430_c1_g1~~TRINITY_DN1430_c1_g1_i1.p1  ORF type:complete len:706 (+),score=131.25 TRINITY_DN1430_c1_g1_i1:111-2120(+)
MLPAVGGGGGSGEKLLLCFAPHAHGHGECVKVALPLSIPELTRQAAAIAEEVYRIAPIHPTELRLAYHDATGQLCGIYEASFGSFIEDIADRRRCDLHCGATKVYVQHLPAVPPGVALPLLQGLPPPQGPELLEDPGSESGEESLYEEESETVSTATCGDTGYSTDYSTPVPGRLRNYSAADAASASTAATVGYSGYSLASDTPSGQPVRHSAAAALPPYQFFHSQAHPGCHPPPHQHAPPHQQPPPHQSHPHRGSPRAATAGHYYGGRHPHPPPGAPGPPPPYRPPAPLSTVENDERAWRRQLVAAERLDRQGTRVRRREDSVAISAAAAQGAARATVVADELLQRSRISLAATRARPPSASRPLAPLLPPQQQRSPCRPTAPRSAPPVRRAGSLPALPTHLVRAPLPAPGPAPTPPAPAPAPAPTAAPAAAPAGVPPRAAAAGRAAADEPALQRAEQQERAAAALEHTESQAAVAGNEGVGRGQLRQQEAAAFGELTADAAQCWLRLSFGTTPPGAALQEHAARSPQPSPGCRRPPNTGPRAPKSPEAPSPIPPGAHALQQRGSIGSSGATVVRRRNSPPQIPAGTEPRPRASPSDPPPGAPGAADSVRGWPRPLPGTPPLQPLLSAVMPFLLWPLLRTLPALDGDGRPVQTADCVLGPGPPPLPVG